MPRVTTEDVPPPQQESRWSEIVAGYLGLTGPVVRVEPQRRLEARPKKGFLGRVEYADLDYFRCVRLTTEPHRLTIKQCSSRLTTIAFQTSGKSTFRSNERVASIRPGQWLIVNPEQSFQVTHYGRVEAMYLLFPGHRLPALQAVALTAFRAQKGIERLTYDFIAGMFATVSDIQSSASAVADNVARLLLHAILDRAPEEQDESNAASQVDRHDIQLFIERNLADPLLSLESIAASFACSKRTIHRCFQAVDGETVERFIWRRRVERCADELFVCESITELAYKYGFSSSAHFSRLFRQVYGVSPSAYCRQ